MTQRWIHWGFLFVTASFTVLAPQKKILSCGIALTSQSARIVNNVVWAHTSELLTELAQKHLESFGYNVRTFSTRLLTPLQRISRTPADVLIVDGDISSKRLIRIVNLSRCQNHNLKILLLARKFTPRVIKNHWAVQAHGALQETQKLSELVPSIERLGHGETVFPTVFTDISVKMFRDGEHPERLRTIEPLPLSFRELQVLSFIGKNLSDREIASELGIETATVRRHLYNIFGRLGVANREEAFIYAIERGLFEESLLDMTEQEVLRRVGLHLTNPQIAAQLNLAVHQVKDILKGIYRKLEVTGRREAYQSFFKAKAPAENSRLSDPQLDVLTLVGEGLSNQQIANVLHISKSTVRVHLNAVNHVLGTKGRWQAYQIAVELDLF